MSHFVCLTKENSSKSGIESPLSPQTPCHLLKSDGDRCAVHVLMRSKQAALPTGPDYSVFQLRYVATTDYSPNTHAYMHKT